MIILGLNAYHGDASAAILVDGRLVAAVEEERFTRVKHTAGFPAHAVRYCLGAAGIRLRDLDHVAVARRPGARLLHKLRFALRLPRFALERARVAGRFGRITDALVATCDDDPEALRARVHRVEHHRAHLASAFFVSPFERAAVLSLDGLGDFGSGLWGVGEGNRITVRGGVDFPHSVGLCYTAVTQYLGFPRYGDEYKVMGLAAYGEPEHLDEFRRILSMNGRLGYALDLEYFTHHRVGAGMTWEKGEPVLDSLYSPHLVRRLGPERAPGAAIERRHENVAASLQARLEELVLGLVRELARASALDALAYAGGVAFNCVANGKALRSGAVDRLYIQPAAGDAGLAIGAAYHVWHEVLGRRRDFVMDHAAWGPGYEAGEIRRALEAAGVPFRRLDAASLIAETARRVADGKVVGWFQGRTEWAPRALGNRSIVADPRRAEMREILNVRVKHREPFRPFAPSVLAEHLGEWFEGTHPSPFMLLAYPVRADRRHQIPAPTHVDGTGRVQTVDRVTNPDYWRLIAEFNRLTGVPVVLNTSFNDNEPIVNTPAEALDCYRRTAMDALAIGPFLVEREPGGP